MSVVNARLFLPRTLLVPVGLEPLPALVLRHLQSTFLFQIAHGELNEGMTVLRRTGCVKLNFSAAPLGRTDGYVDSGTLSWAWVNTTSALTSPKDSPVSSATTRRYNCN